MSEAGFQLEVMTLAISMARLVHHCRDARRCGGHAGFPDLLILGSCGLLLAELKMPGGHLDAGQVAWKYSLLAAGVPYYVWEPADLASGLIECHIRAST